MEIKNHVGFYPAILMMISSDIEFWWILQQVRNYLIFGQKD